MLWFDEHDENLYRFESSLNAAQDADLLLVIGTSGATNLPNHMVSVAVRKGAFLIDINPAETLLVGLLSKSTEASPYVGHRAVVFHRLSRH